MTALHRDRLTWLVYLQLGVYGYFLYGFGPTVPLLRAEQGVSRTLSGLHGTALAVGALAAAVVAAGVIRSWGRAVVLWGGVALIVAGIGVYVVTTALPLTLLGAFLASLGGSFVVTATPPALSELHGAAGPTAISEANALAAGVGTVAPLAVGAAVAVGVGWRGGLLLLVPVVAVLAWTMRGVRIPPPAESPAHHGGSRRLPPRYWVGWSVLVAGIAVEFCMILWAADLLHSRLGLSPGAAAAGVTAFVAGMCTGRLLGGRLALRLGVDPLLYGAIGVALGGFAVFWLAGWPPAALGGLVLCGLGVALLYPLGIVRAMDASDGRPDLATARAGFAAALAVGGGPFALGALADQVGIRSAFLVAPALLVLAALGVLLGGRSAYPPVSERRVGAG